MTPISELDLSGDFRVHPFAELLVEITQARLTGSVRIDSGTRKSVVYFRDGAVVFAISNSKEFRLAARLLAAHTVTQADLRKAGQHANDLDLAAALRDAGVLDEDGVNNAFVSQIGAIIIDALTWTSGTWSFSPLARLRSDVKFEIPLQQLLIDYARCVPLEAVMSRFKSVHERFVRPLEKTSDALLQPHEAAVLALFHDAPLDFSQVRSQINMPDNALGHALYVLWLGGELLRLGWNKAFTDNRIADIKKTRFSRVKEALPLASLQSSSQPAEQQPGSTQTPAPVEEPAVPKAALPEIELSEWLERAEGAETHYDLLDVAPDAGTDVIKNAYFSLARLFHPDRFHRETGAQLRRIQVAFTSLAHAYDILKNSESRQSYDYKIRRELELREKRLAEGTPDSAGMQAEQALDNFERGLAHLSEDEFEAATAYLARAVHYSPTNALYRAYYGKALSYDDRQLHKAETEMLSAVRLEPANSKIRMILVNFFLDRNLKKRAEGELKRFLEIAPDNSEARDLLTSLQA